MFQFIFRSVRISEFASPRHYTSYEKPTEDNHNQDTLNNECLKLYLPVKSYLCRSFVGKNVATVATSTIATLYIKNKLLKNIYIFLVIFLKTPFSLLHLTTTPPP